MESNVTLSTILPTADNVTKIVTEIVNTTLASVTTTVFPVANATVPGTSTTTTTVVPNTSTTTTTMPSSTTTFESTVSTEIDNSSPLPFEAGGSSLLMYFFSTVIFVTAICLVVKVIISNRKKRDLIGGSARWRLATSSQSAAPLQTSAMYAPMNNQRSQNMRNPMDLSSGENRLDWERQFFDDHDASTQPQSRLQLDFSREY